MFESVATSVEALDRLTRLRHERLVRECAELELVAHWGDLNSTERGLDPFATVELGAVLATTTTAADRLLGDATDLRDRWPGLWGLVRAGAVPAWKARKISQAARHLDDPAVLRLDAALDGLVTSLPWGRFAKILDAQIITADPAQAERHAEQWDADQFVRTGQTRRHGLKLLVARAAAGDVIWFMAMVNRIADILEAEGDHDPVDHRRARAIGILGQPALALQLLARHHVPDQPAEGAPGERESAGADADADADPEVEEPAPESDDHVSVRLDTPTGPLLDPARVAPKVVLHIHLSRDALTTGTGVARIEGVGPVTVSEVRDFLGTRLCRIRVQPVLDPTDVTPVDAYEIPTRTAEALRYRHPVEVFPYGTHASRTPDGTADLDHTIPYLSPARGGPLGQTGPANLGPLSRRHHRAKTHGGWTVRQPEPGVYVWRSPRGHVFHVDHHGTHPLGAGTYARALWSAVTRLDRAARHHARQTYERVA